MLDMALSLIESASRVSVEALVNGLWQGMALTAALWALLKLIPRLTPSARYVVWSAALAVVVALPFVSGQQTLQRALRSAHELVFTSNVNEQSLSRDKEVVGERSRSSAKSLVAASHINRTDKTQPEIVSDETPANQPDESLQLAAATPGNELTVNKATTPAFSLTLTSAIALSLFAAWLFVS
ncbi:MAG: hypothetical protein IH914_07690, partial [candidate division Zixibacteria bacterium]|nr:hypothetical protein [candidate division Zixibacteria bacterium]